MESAADYKLKIRVYNNKMLSRIKKAGYASIAEFCRRNNGLNVSHVSAAARMAIPLKRANGDWLDLAFDISSALRCEPEEIFNNTRHVEGKARVVERSISEGDLLAIESSGRSAASSLLGPDLVNTKTIQKIAMMGLEKLTPRQRRVIQMRFFEEKTLAECSIVLNIGRERVRGIEAKALEKMRQFYSRGSNKGIVADAIDAVWENDRL